MPLWLGSFALFSETLIRFLLTWSWQAFWLLSFVWLYLKFDRKRTSALRHKIWLAALFGVAIFPLMSYALQIFPLSPARPALADVPFTLIKDVVLVSQNTPLQSNVASEHTATITSQQHLTLYQLLTIIWVLGVTLLLICLFWGYRNMCRIFERAAPTTLSDLGCDVPALRLPGNVRVGLSHEAASPLVFGFFRPKILLPANITSWTTVEERVAILQHELTHIRRGDAYVNLFQALLTALCFFHPLVRHALKQLMIESEMAADAEVIKSGVEARPYAEIILKVAEKSINPGWFYQPASFSTKKSLQRRLKMIMDSNRPAVSRQSQQLYYVLAAVIMAGVFLALAPTRSAVHAGKLVAAPHTTTLVEKLQIQGRGEFLSSREIHAVRANGAESTTEESFRESSPQPVLARRTVIFPDRMKVVLIDALRSKSTSRLSEADYNESYVLGRRNPQEKCMKTYGWQAIDMNGVTYLGEEKIDGINAYRIVLSKQSLGIEQWMAPSLGCEVLKQSVQISDSPRQESHKSLENIVMSEPEATLFAVPDDYEEVKPSELGARMREKLFGRRDAGYGTAGAESDRRADLKYNSSRP